LGQPGERYGPRDLRENSQEYAHDLTEGFYYIDGERTLLKGQALGGCRGRDCVSTVPAETGQKTTDAVKKILAKKSFPIILAATTALPFR